MRHIIFDLGNVLVRLDAEACRAAFRQLGMETLLDRRHDEAQATMQQLGLGQISIQNFCQKARELSGSQATDEAVCRAANAMLIEIPDEKKRRLLRLRAHGHRVYLLSNTNAIHWDYCVTRLFPYRNYGVADYFDRIFLSQEMHLQKPDPEIFHEVLRQTGIRPEDSLFIDDLAENCEAARNVGMQTFQNKDFDDWEHFLDHNL